MSCVLGYIEIECAYVCLPQKKLQDIGPPPDEEPPEIPTDELMVSSTGAPL